MDLQTNASKVVEMHRKLKTLEAQFAAAKSNLLADMIEQNVSAIDVKRSVVVLCQRENKDYGDSINSRELELKADKKRLEVMGEFTIKSTTNFIQVR